MSEYLIEGSDTVSVEEDFIAFDGDDGGRCVEAALFASETPMTKDQIRAYVGDQVDITAARHPGSQRVTVACIYCLDSGVSPDQPDYRVQRESIGKPGQIESIRQSVDV